MSAHYTLYRIWRNDGALLYIGSSKDLEGRIKDHQCRSWWQHVDCVTTEDVGTDERKARAAEKAAIQAEHPRHNIVWRSAEHPDGPALVCDSIYLYHPEDFDKAPEGWDGTVSEHLPPGEKAYHLNRFGYPIPPDLARAVAVEQDEIEEAIEAMVREDRLPTFRRISRRGAWAAA